ncbi:hypothetical protein O181_018683 [Austropuccinia psidii MF-1]|uniref:Chromo domain-containing protein n=1 Tax=Austropuccinia psidii MF-1 TaxID=1389203 RepID=A0A9Q3C8A2_9BASI|nr:hypothetical protein [Austropuccinia psidii MF-1]
MEVSTTCIPCFLIRTSQAISYPKPKSISTTPSPSGGAGQMGSGSGYGLNLKRGKLWYIVEWKGLSDDPERITWEPDSNLTSLPDLVNDFPTMHPDKPGKNTSRV